MSKTWPIEKKFWSKINKRGPRHPSLAGFCWVWTGKLKKGSGGGYGILTEMVDGKERCYRAHRVSWELHYGPIPDNLCVLHKCDNRACVRPTHLFLGTRGQNTEDMVAKGRYINGMKGRKHSPRTLQRMQEAQQSRRNRERIG
jgi:hypothetical protein